MNEWLDLQQLQKGPTKIGGTCEVLAVPEEDIEVFPVLNPVTQTVTQSIVLKSGKKWFGFTLNSKSRAFREQMQVDKAGIYFNQNVAGRLYSKNLNNHLQLHNMVRHRWVVLARERTTGLTYIIGKPGSSSTLTVNYDSQAQTITDLLFSKSCRHGAWIYGATFPGTIEKEKPETFLIKMLAEFRIGEAGRPADGANLFDTVKVPELIGKTKIAVWVDGMLKSGKGLSDVLSYTQNPTTFELNWNQNLADKSVIQIYEVDN